MSGRRRPMSVEEIQAVWAIPPMFGATIKSIQHGTVTADTNTNVIINSVDRSKSILFITHGGTYNESDTGGLYVNVISVKAQLTSNTNINLQVANALGPQVVAWTVVEFASGVTVQRGEADVFSTAGSNIADITISTVAIERSFVVFTYNGNHSTPSPNRWQPYAFLQSSTNLRIQKTMARAFMMSTAWQVVSFS